MTIRPADDGVDAEERLQRALFSDEARGDPHSLLRSASLPGCHHAVVEQMLRRFVPPESAWIGSATKPLWEMLGRWLVSIDGERHVRLRRRFMGLFAPRTIEHFRGVIAQRAAGLIDAVAGSRSMDLVPDFARPLPYSVIVEVLGVPADRHGWVLEHMVTLGQGFARQLEPEWVERAGVAVTEMQDYYSALLDERAAHPREDLLSVLATDLPQDAEARADLVANCVFFVEAGHATTTSLLSVGTLLLLQHPEQLSRLRRDPALIMTTVEEMLRLISPLTMIVRHAREDVEIDGYRFPAGVNRRAILAAANRDPSVFDDPDRFDVGRTPNRHLAFGAGPHFCLGAPLARLHGEIAIPMLLERLGGLRLDGDPLWRGSLPTRELEHLPVAWEADLAR